VILPFLLLLVFSLLLWVLFSLVLQYEMKFYLLFSFHFHHFNYSAFFINFISSIRYINNWMNLKRVWIMIIYCRQGIHHLHNQQSSLILVYQSLRYENYIMMIIVIFKGDFIRKIHVWICYPS
jgi:hypothetical protein